MQTLASVGKRRQKRAKMVLPVRVIRGTGAEKMTYLAHTLDISYGGVRVGGLRVQIVPGEVVLVQYGTRRAKHRVVWVNPLGSGEVHFGAESLEPGIDLWQLELPEELYDRYRPTETHGQ